MTGPTEPTPGAPAGPTAPPTAPPAPTAPPTPTAPAGPWTGFTWDGNVDALPPDVAKVIRDARADAGKARTDAKANAAAEARSALAADVAKALGLQGDAPPSPEKLMQDLTAARDNSWALAVELEVLRITDAQTASGLLDSVKFLDSLDELGDKDPRSDEFREALKAKVQAATANSTTNAPAGQAPGGPRPDPSQGTRGTPPSANRSTSLTQTLMAHYAAKGAGR